MATQSIKTIEQPTSPERIPAVVKELQAMAPKFAAVLPPHIPVERFVRVCLSALNQNPDLMKCDAKSLLQSALTAAQLGLEPDANLGQAYFVPFFDNKNGTKKVQLIPGYKGYLALARNSGEIISFSAHEVCENDHFDYSFGLDERLEHTPALKDRGPVTHFYAVARFKDGSHHFDVMTLDEVNAVRNKSKAGSKGPWVDHFVEMGKKTVIRRIAKYLPLSVQKAAALENAVMAGGYGSTNEFGDVVIDCPAEEAPEQLPETSSSALDAFANPDGQQKGIFQDA